MGRLGSFEIGQRLEILIFWGWGDRLGVWDRYQGRGEGLGDRD